MSVIRLVKAFCDNTIEGWIKNQMHGIMANLQFPELNIIYQIEIVNLVKCQLNKDWRTSPGWRTIR
jgi:hypothetical protein